MIDFLSLFFLFPFLDLPFKMTSSCEEGSFLLVEIHNGISFHLLTIICHRICNGSIHEMDRKVFYLFA